MPNHSVPIRRRSPLGGVAGAAVQLGIIGGLLYAGLFVKAEVEVPNIETPAIEKRDVFYSVSAPAPGVIWAAGSLGKVVRSEDDGESWQIQPTPTGAHLQSIAAWDVRRAVAVGNNGVVLTTEDGGGHWQEAQAPSSKVANKLIRVRIRNEGEAWAVGQMGALLVSRDYGRSWQRQAEEQDLAWNDVAFQGDAGWVVGEFGRAMRSVDGGATWQEVDTPVESSLMAVAFRDARHGVAVGVSGTLLVSDDGGASWRAAQAGTVEHLLDVVWDGSRWIVVGDKGMLVTSDASAGSWQAGKVAENHLGWYTQVLPAGGGYLLAGSSLSRLHGRALSVLGGNS